MTEPRAAGSGPARVLLVAFDGAPAEAFQQGMTPHLTRLLRSGAHTWNAQSVLPTWSLFCYVAILTGVRPIAYELCADPEGWLTPRQYPIPSLFELAQQAGLHTAMFTNWHPLNELPKPDTVDTMFSSSVSSAVVVESAAQYLGSQQPHLCFVHLDDPDHAGHTHGWRTPQQYEAVGGCDEHLGTLLRTLEEAGTLTETAVFVVSDHAGGMVTPFLHGTGEDPAYSHPLTLTVPWVCSGPGIARNHQILGPVSILDTTPTIAALLGLPERPEWEGAAVREALAAGVIEGLERE